jgi:hypothetical protein
MFHVCIVVTGFLRCCALIPQDGLIVTSLSYSIVRKRVPGVYLVTQPKDVLHIPHGAWVWEKLEVITPCLLNSHLGRFTNSATPTPLRISHRTDTA